MIHVERQSIYILFTKIKDNQNTARKQLELI